MAILFSKPFELSPVHKPFDKTPNFPFSAVWFYLPSICFIYLTFIYYFLHFLSCILAAWRTWLTPKDYGQTPRAIGQSLSMATCEEHTWKIRAKSTSQVHEPPWSHKTVFGDVGSNACVSLSRTGVGDFQVTDINFLPDPCPLPDAQKKRALNEKERLLYAPMAGVGGLVYDKDAVYIDVPANHINQQVLGIYLRNMIIFFKYHTIFTLYSLALFLPFYFSIILISYCNRIYSFCIICN